MHHQHSAADHVHDLHVHYLDLRATGPTITSSLESGLDWCFQHVQTNSLNKTSNQNTQKSVPNASSRQLLESFLAYLHDSTFAVYTKGSWKQFILPVFAIWPLYTQQEVQVCSIWSQTTALYALMLRTKRFQLSSVLFCSVCLPDVVFWFGAYSRNNTATHKNRKWTEIYQLHQTCPAQSYRNSMSSRIQHSSSMKRSYVRYSFLSPTELWANKLSNLQRWTFQTWSALHFQVLILRALRIVLLLTCRPPPPSCTFVLGFITLH